MDKANMFWQTYLNLENEILNLSKYIYITDTTTQINHKSKKTKNIDYKGHLKTYSVYIADLLVRCCIEIEAISKELYFDNGGVKARGSANLYFDTDCIALLNQKWKLDNKVVMIVASNFNLLKDENRILTPLKKLVNVLKQFGLELIKQLNMIDIIRCILEILKRFFMPPLLYFY